MMKNICPTSHTHTHTHIPSTVFNVQLSMNRKRHMIWCKNFLPGPESQWMVLTPSVNIPTACYLYNPLKPREEKTKQESDRTKDMIK
jgi:hypothetical protein